MRNMIAGLVVVSTWAACKFAVDTTHAGSGPTYTRTNANWPSPPAIIIIIICYQFVVSPSRRDHFDGVIDPSYPDILLPAVLTPRSPTRILCLCVKQSYSLFLSYAPPFREDQDTTQLSL